MIREERQRLTAKSSATRSTEPAKSPNEERDALIAQLYNTPGWGALQELLQSLAPFRVPDTGDPNFQVKLHESVFRAQFVVQILKAVKLAHERTQQAKGTA